MSNNTAPFANGTLVRGVVCGLFRVIGSKRAAAGFWIVKVREIGPEGQLSSHVLRFPHDILVKCENQKNA